MKGFFITDLDGGMVTWSLYFSCFLLNTSIQTTQDTGKILRRKIDGDVARIISSKLIYDFFAIYWERKWKTEQVEKREDWSGNKHFENINHFPKRNKKESFITPKKLPKKMKNYNKIEILYFDIIHNFLNSKLKTCANIS